MNTSKLSAAGNPKSRLGPINEHLIVSGAAVTRLVGFFEAALAGDWRSAARLQDGIRIVEQRSQQSKRKLQRRISRYFMLSGVCRKLIDLLSAQGGVTFHARKIVVMVYTRRIVFPPAIREQMLSLVKTVVMMSEKNLETVAAFDRRLVEPDGERKTSPVDSLPGDLGRLERDCRRLSMSVRTRLYRGKSRIEPTELMLLLYVIELVGDLAERSHKAGNCLQLLLAPGRRQA